MPNPFLITERKLVNNSFHRTDGWKENEQSHFPHNYYQIMEEMNMVI